jgi:hypothetical protein
VCGNIGEELEDRLLRRTVIPGPQRLGCRCARKRPNETYKYERKFGRSIARAAATPVVRRIHDYSFSCRARFFLTLASALRTPTAQRRSMSLSEP